MGDCERLTGTCIDRHERWSNAYIEYATPSGCGSKMRQFKHHQEAEMYKWIDDHLKHYLLTGEIGDL